MKLLQIVALCLGLFVVLPDARGQNPAPATPPAEKDGALTVGSMKTMLENMGYEVTVTNNACQFQMPVQIDKQTWTFHATTEISPNQKKFWISANLSKIDENMKDIESNLLKLLETNWETGPGHFRFYSKTRLISFGLPRDNVGFTPAILRTEIDTFAARIRTTESVWNTKKWGASTPAPSTPAKQ